MALSAWDQLIVARLLARAVTARPCGVAGSGLTVTTMGGELLDWVPSKVTQASKV